jgi:hypothetical protein
MSTITTPQPDLTGEQLAAILRAALGSRYNVLPGMRTVRRPLAKPEPASPDTIVVGTGSNRLFTASVTVIRNPDGSLLQISPGGMGWETIVNTFGVARKVRQVLTAALPALQ